MRSRIKSTGHRRSTVLIVLSLCKNRRTFAQAQRTIVPGGSTLQKIANKFHHIPQFKFLLECRYSAANLMRSKKSVKQKIANIGANYLCNWVNSSLIQHRSRDMPSLIMKAIYREIAKHASYLTRILVTVKYPYGGNIDDV